MHFSNSRRMLSINAAATSLGKSNFHVTSIMAFAKGSDLIILPPYGVTATLRLIEHMWQEPGCGQKFAKDPTHLLPGYLLYTVPRALFCCLELREQHPQIMKYANDLFSDRKFILKKLNSRSGNEAFIREAEERFGTWLAVEPFKDISRLNEEKDRYIRHIEQMMAAVGMPYQDLSPNAPDEFNEPMPNFVPVPFPSPDAAHEKVKNYETNLHSLIYNDALIKKATAIVMEQLLRPKPYR